MANPNRVFVSPGVYTSEKDLSFVSQSVGVTTLGMVGETLRGPAFEPILITNFDEFRTYFGGTSPIKDGLNNPRYELSYAAKSFLQESNQLFVTRVLGLTGFRAGRTYGIQTLGGITVDYDVEPEKSEGFIDLENVESGDFYGDLSGKTATSGSSIPTFISQGTYTHNDWFTIGMVPDDEIVNLSGTRLDSPIGNNTNKNWYNTFFTQSGSTIDGVYSYLFVYSSGTTSFDVTRFKYSASLNQEYDGKVVLALRSRGGYNLDTLNHRVTGSTAVQISGTSITSNPMSDFTINVTDVDGDLRTFNCSLDISSSKYVTKVLGTEVFDKDRINYPVYVHEVYPNLLKGLYDLGLVRGLSLTEISINEGESFLTQWDTAGSAMIVSEVRGGDTAELFKIITISDGDGANYTVKITLQNIDIESGEFDLVVRDFNDTDENMIVLESYTRCSMNPDSVGYVGRKVGTADGMYELRSKYIMLHMVEDHPSDAIPCGFKGVTTKSNIGEILYKTKYFEAGDIIYYMADGTPVTSNGDKIRRVSLGFSTSQTTKYDRDILKYKGKNANQTTYGFHLSVGAANIVDNNGKTIYKTTPYNLEAIDKGKLSQTAFRKFTLPVYGGFDGWDIYRNIRTNTDSYIFGKSAYTKNHINGGGVLSDTVGNSDYYAFLQGIETYSNPEAVNINLFSTPGIDWFNHSSLVAQAVDMIETDRADSLYVVNTPNFKTVQETIDALSDIGIDSSYSATYWPWIQVRDTDNATQLLIPPTGEVLKNFALTDNVANPWNATAGYARGIVNSIKAGVKLKLTDRNELYKARINPIATFADTGTIIWGNKTLQVRESALDRINVRRLLLTTRKLISAVSVRLLFDQNDEQIRQEFLSLVNPILDSIKRERGIFEFRVTVSNDPEDIDSNTLRGKIFIKPTRALEFIDVEFIVTPTGASFENI